MLPSHRALFAEDMLTLSLFKKSLPSLLSNERPTSDDPSSIIAQETDSQTVSRPKL